MVKIAQPAKNPSSQDQLAHVTQEMYKKNLELAETNKTLSLLRRIDEVVLGSGSNATNMAQAITDLLVTTSDFNLAMVYTLEKEKKYVLVQGISLSAATSPESEQMLQSYLKTVAIHSPQENAISQVVSTSKIHIATEFTGFSPQITQPISDSLKSGLSVSSILVCPLIAGNFLQGLLLLGLSVTSQEISNYQKNLVERLTGTVSIAMENRLLYQELQEASSQLKAQNIKLKELDQTKDEFISMASHQLRTPLTTIKGYLSMVLEGDAGKVTQQEADMVKKAFDSAQRMVYLIADLLNVSRLQTGKFVLDNKPTNLAELVLGELDQLQEVAKNRRIKLIYNKPASFPILMLDDNKIRQVMMNFLDNAIYYTPPGGEVTAKVEATDTAVTFSVTDTGVGVPKSVQPHLFSKFYRADNARKMRPDGTGLGLFMAKKIIVAQGGALIFFSLEGKGSVFGFSFPRKAMEVNSQPSVGPQGAAAVKTSPAPVAAQPAAQPQQTPPPNPPPQQA